MHRSQGSSILVCRESIHNRGMFVAALSYHFQDARSDTLEHAVALLLGASRVWSRIVV